MAILVFVKDSHSASLLFAVSLLWSLLSMHGTQRKQDPKYLKPLELSGNGYELSHWNNSLNIPSAFNGLNSNPSSVSTFNAMLSSPPGWISRSLKRCELSPAPCWRRTLAWPSRSHWSASSPPCPSALTTSTGWRTSSTARSSRVGALTSVTPPDEIPFDNHAVAISKSSLQWKKIVQNRWVRIGEKIPVCASSSWHTRSISASIPSTNKANPPSTCHNLFVILSLEELFCVHLCVRCSSHWFVTPVQSSASSWWCITLVPCHH